MVKMLTRRRFLGAAAAGAAVGVAGIAQAAPRRVRLTHHRVRWPVGPIRVAQITDVHVGWATPRRLLRQAAALARAAQPDLVVLTGDFVNHSLEHLAELERFVGELPGPCIATLGNHDHWSGAEGVMESLARQGIGTLRNETREMRLGSRRLHVVGVDDARTSNDDVPDALARVANPEAALVLTHAPRAAEAIALHGGRLILAGHTHGGHLRVPILMPLAQRLAGNQYIAGWYRVEGARLYVNAGIGSSAVRARLGRKAQPEVAIFDLVEGQGSGHL